MLLRPTTSMSMQPPPIFLRDVATTQPIPGGGSMVGSHKYHPSSIIGPLFSYYVGGATVMTTSIRLLQLFSMFVWVQNKNCKISNWTGKIEIHGYFATDVVALWRLLSACCFFFHSHSNIIRKINDKITPRTWNYIYCHGGF